MNEATEEEREALDQIVREHDGWWPETRDAILATYVRRSEVPDPQVEPSDAQVEAAHQAWSDYWDRDEGGENRPAIRAALIAAGSVR